jgi:hypothetical protein
MTSGGGTGAEGEAKGGSGTSSEDKADESDCDMSDSVFDRRGPASVLPVSLASPGCSSIPLLSPAASTFATYTSNGSIPT